MEGFAPKDPWRDLSNLDVTAPDWLNSREIPQLDCPQVDQGSKRFIDMIAPDTLNLRGQTSIQLPLIRYILLGSSSFLCFEVKQTWKQLYHAQRCLQTLHHRVIKKALTVHAQRSFLDNLPLDGQH